MKPTVYLLLASLLAGCASQVPLAVNHPISTQLKAKSAHHWDVLADDVANETCTLLENEPKKNPALKGKAFYVPQQPGASTFDRAFRDLLITRMVNHGLPVATTRGTALEIRYETQVVQHNSPRHGHVPGTLTALTGGVWVVREVVVGGSLTSAIPISIGLAALGDWGLGAFATTTPTELIVTTSISQDNKYLYRKSSIYYIATEDADLYLENTPVTDLPGLERGVKRLEVVGQ